LVTFIIERPADAPEYVLQALEAALAAPTDSGRPTLFGSVIEFLLYRNRRLAVEILERVLRAPSIAVLGKQARKDIANRLRSLARNLARVVSKEEREHMLSLVPSLEAVLQRVVVEAVCHEVFDQSVEQINDLLSKPGLAESTVELIRRHKYTRERAMGSETWVKLYSLLAPRRA
jgi:hypothetical protein